MVERPGTPHGTPQVLANLPDGVLLRRFSAGREQEAFTELVQRHDRLVRGVCMQVLGDAHLAQDASQATFLVLARRAGILDGRGSLAGWLYKVAYHLALRFRAAADRQRRREQAGGGRAAQNGDIFTDLLEQEELRQALSEELQQLPEKYRVPLVLCYFDGRTHAEVGRAIGVPRGSIAKRIGEGLEQLRERLVDRGFAL